MAEPLSWGILGTGNIARQFATGVRASRRGRLAAVASRSDESARAFAATHAIPTAYGHYDPLLADPAVTAVYISLPNSMHHEWTLKALRAGKHVLCEKPLATDAAQAEEMFQVAQQQGLILVEAFMYRCHPLTHAVLDTLRQGQIGTPKLIRTSFCFRVTKTAGNIRFSKALAGGVLMDVGCYCVSFSRLIAGEDPADVSAYARFHPSGVDEITAGVLRYPSGLLATFTCGMSVQADNTASICGDEGYIEIPIPWKPPVTDAVYIVGRSTPPRMDHAGKPVPQPPPRETRKVSAGMELYGLEADDFARFVLDSDPVRITREESLSNMRTLDRLRNAIGLHW